MSGGPDPRVTVVVLTHNRVASLGRTLDQLARLDEAPRVIVVDNASTDGTPAWVAQVHPQMNLVRSPCNLGAAARNLGVARVRTPCVAFCDDDTWWADGALRHAADLLARHRDLAVINGRVVVEPGGYTDPTCDDMARSPLDRRGLPGPALLHFMAGAVVMRTAAYRAVGGYEPRFFLGGEETLMGLDLAAQGWRICYRNDVVVHHHPGLRQDPPRQRRLLTWRNRLWVAWMRLPWAAAWAETGRIRAGARADGLSGAELWRAALSGLPWVCSRRRRVPHDVAALHERLREAFEVTSPNVGRRPASPSPTGAIKATAPKPGDGV